MNFFKKDWTPNEADEWTIHDLTACVLSAISYFLLAIGTMGALLLQLWGFICLFVAIIIAVVMYFIIDPKLKAISKAFAKKQQEYLEDVERSTRWEQ